MKLALMLVCAVPAAAQKFYVEVINRHGLGQP